MIMTNGCQHEHGGASGKKPEQTKPKPTAKRPKAEPANKKDIAVRD
jgi:hypothetical protein